jgi:hypothetical protein
VEPRQSGTPPDDPVATALGEYHCPACGAEAHWNPSRRALICPYCGTVSPASPGTAPGVIVEHDLARALREIPDSARGWNARTTSVRCQSCRAISVFDADHVGRRCDFCGSSALVSYEEVKEAFRPESLVPLTIAESQARDLIRAWYGRQWLAPNPFSRQALTDTVHGVYLPYWTFDAAADARWTAESGTYYWVREGSKQVRRTRWTPAAGALSHAFDDELVCASSGVQAALLRRVEPFPASTLVPYDPRYLAGWTVERYQIDLVTAAQHSRDLMDGKLRAMCGRQVPGDTYRNLRVDATYRQQTFKHILAPVWLLTYSYGTRTYQVVVNGATGSIAGTRPWSAVKIAFLVLLALLVLYGLNAWG